MDNISTKFSGLAQKNWEHRLVRVGTNMVGGTQAAERGMKNTAGGGGGGGLGWVRQALTFFSQP